jgi:type I restriction enzyme M protein
MLSKLTQAGQNGQFRTPRHIIKMMVQLMEPGPREIVCDPACGTGGFLVAVAEYLRDLKDSDGNSVLNAPGNREHYDHEMFHGFDFDATMLRIGSMNLMLHGIELAGGQRRLKILCSKRYSAMEQKKIGQK